jgi:hypothetical protein
MGKAAFDSLDWRRFDVFALLALRGVATVEQVLSHACEDGLRDRGYRLVALDFTMGIGPALAQLGAMLNWRERFGYDLSPASRNLDALRDGFDLRVGDEGGVALMLRSFARAWREDEAWCRGLLGLVSERSLRELALGRRFLAVIVLADEAAPLVGQALEGHVIPSPWSGPF